MNYNIGDSTTAEVQLALSFNHYIALIEGLLTIPHNYEIFDWLQTLWWFRKLCMYLCTFVVHCLATKAVILPMTGWVHNSEVTIGVQSTVICISCTLIKLLHRLLVCSLFFQHVANNYYCFRYSKSVHKVFTSTFNLACELKDIKVCVRVTQVCYCVHVYMHLHEKLKNDVCPNKWKLLNCWSKVAML